MNLASGSNTLRSCARNATVDSDRIPQDTRAMIQTTLLVAFGGAIGASARFLLGTVLVRLAPSGFPIAVLTANVVGSVLMGVAVVYLGRTGSSLAPFVMTGILGGFTTFSAFSLEAYTLFDRGDWGQAALYVGLSVALSILGLVAGIVFTRMAVA